MKISGFTIIRNAILSDYPVVEAILSVLPIIDEMVVLIGKSDDDTENLIRNINSSKIKIHHSIWDTKKYKNGNVLSVETNKALDLIDSESTWALYIQADEAIHEKYYSTILNACKKYADDDNVEGLLFNYLHFYGTYDYVADSRRWYNKEVRVIRNQKKIKSYKDAQGFRVGNRKIKVKSIDAYIYHYGWVRSLEAIYAKNKHVKDVWHSENFINGIESPTPDLSEISLNMNAFDSLRIFTDTHPEVWHKRIEEKNWNYDLDISQKKFSAKDKILFWLEKKTGKRFFYFRNYKII